MNRNQVPTVLPSRQRPSSRSSILSILCSGDKHGAPIDGVITSHEHEIAARDQQLVKNIVYGVLRQRGYLDFIIKKYSRHPLVKMKTRTLMALRMGTYQILFLDRIPDSAAINETVAALKHIGQPKWLTGFVNGILRSISRNKTSLPDLEKTGKNSREILNHPDWLIERWTQAFGKEKTREICRQNNSLPPLILRVNTRRVTIKEVRRTFEQNGIQAEPGKYSPAALVLRSSFGPIASLPGFADGLFQVQDEAAQLVSLLFDRGNKHDEEEKILDGCAGLGGKTSHLAEIASPGRTIVAVEPEQRRFKLLKENLTRLQPANRVTCHPLSLEQFAASHTEKFSGILIDAPCSGTGVIRRHPDIRWNRQPGDLKRYQHKQLILLQNVATLLEPGGVLVYATCSMEKEENEEVVSAFLESHSHFVVSDCAEYLPTRARSLVDSTGYLSTSPADGLDGFFAARLIKKAG